MRGLIGSRRVPYVTSMADGRCCRQGRYRVATRALRCLWHEVCVDERTNTSLLRQEPRDHCPPFSGTTPQVIKKKHISVRFSRGRERWACSFFRKLAGRRCWIQELRLAVALARKEHAHSTQRDRLTRKAAEPEAAACVSVPDCTRTMTSPAQNFLKAALRAAMFAQCADRRPR